VIVGFNTDIKHRGATYHTQTEDKGRSNPLLETHIYRSGGRIMDTLRTRYDELVAGEYDEARVLQMMENQHRRAIQLIKSDAYLSDEEKAEAARLDEEKLRVIGAASENETSFDELVSSWLTEEQAEEEVELNLMTDGQLLAGHQVELRLKATKKVSRGMIAGAGLTIRFISTVRAPEVVFEGETDRMGECAAVFTLPPLDGGTGAIIIECESDFGTAQVRQLVLRAA